MMKTAQNRNHCESDINESALTMALAILVDRIRSLPPEDKEDLFEISKLLIGAETEEERQSAVAAYREILDQKSDKIIPLFVDDEPIGLTEWVVFVSGKIKAAREEAHLTQDELAKKTGLPQSHISRLENGVHSPAAATLEKIATATEKPMSYFDPNYSNVKDGDEE